VVLLQVLKWPLLMRLKPRRRIVLFESSELEAGASSKVGSGERDGK
jgi:hypothetical protein